MNSHSTPASQPAQTRASNAEIDPAAGYEKRDVNISSLLWLAAAIAGTIVVTGIGVWVLYAYYQSAALRADPPRSPWEVAEQVPPLPHLQATPNRDYREFRQAQEAAINSYGWVDKQQGIVHVPIERAMELLLEQGLPKTPAAQPESADGEAGQTQVPDGSTLAPMQDGAPQP